MKRFFTYVGESFGEIKHVKWPTKRETVVYTIAIIIISVVTAYYLGLFDLIFGDLLKRIIS
jgi:preprotein translocase SecE subunit